MRIEIVQTRDGTGTYWWVRLRARNNRTVVVSEVYETRRSALRAVKLILGAGKALVVEVKVD